MKKISENANDNVYQPKNNPLLIINSENSEMTQGRDKKTKVIANYINVNKG